MRRILLVIVMLFCSLCTVTAENMEMRYSIQCDSKQNEEWELKHQIMAVYDELTEGVEEGSRCVMIRSSLDRFELDDRTEVKLKDNELILIHGDGKGSLIRGRFEEYRCAGKLVKKSLFHEILDNMNK